MSYKISILLKNWKSTLMLRGWSFPSNFVKNVVRIKKNRTGKSKSTFRIFMMQEFWIFFNNDNPHDAGIQETDSVSLLLWGKKSSKSKSRSRRASLGAAFEGKAASAKGKAASASLGAAIQETDCVCTQSK